MYIPNGAFLLKNDEGTKESRNYGVAHQVEQPTNRRIDMGRIFHREASTTNKTLGTVLV